MDERTTFAEASEAHLPRRLSRVLADLAASQGERVSIGDITAALADRGFAGLLMLFSLPNLAPLPPGSSAVLGIPLMIVSAQLMVGYFRPWFPDAIRSRSMDRSTFAAIVTRTEPLLLRVEKLARPRYWPFSRIVADRLAGVLIFILSVILFLPVPFGNFIPALAILILALSLAERDGIWFGAGSLLFLASMGIVAGVVVAGAAAIRMF